MSLITFVAGVCVVAGSAIIVFGFLLGMAELRLLREVQDATRQVKQIRGSGASRRRGEGGNMVDEASETKTIQLQVGPRGSSWLSTHMSGEH